MKQSEFKFFIQVESYDEKTAENYRNCYVTEKRIVSKLSKISIQNCNNTNWRLERKLCHKIWRPYLLYFPRNKPSKNVMVWPGLVRQGMFIVLNGLASPKMSIQSYFNFIQCLLKVFRAAWLSSRRPIYDC